MGADGLRKESASVAVTTERGGASKGARTAETQNNVSTDVGARNHNPIDKCEHVNYKLGGQSCVCTPE